MRPAAYIAHHIPGRIRIRIPAAKRNSQLLSQVGEKLAKVSGVESVESSALTGSVLIRYDPELHGKLVRILNGPGESAMPFELTAQKAPPARPRARSRRRKSRRRSHVAEAVSDLFTEFDDAIRDATDNELDLKVLLPVVAAAFGLWVLPRAASTPLWLTLMIFSFHSFMSLNAGDSFGLEAIEASEELLG
jgi:hypothetical protein